MTFTASVRIRVYNINGLHVDWIEVGQSVTTQGNPITICGREMYKVEDGRFISLGDVFWQVCVSAPLGVGGGE